APSGCGSARVCPTRSLPWTAIRGCVRRWPPRPDAPRSRRSGSVNSTWVAATICMRWSAPAVWTRYWPNRNDNKAQSMTEQATPQFSLQRIYVKDLSFEAPKSPEIFRQEWNPTVQPDLNTRTKTMETDIHEVVLTHSATVKSGHELAIGAEVQPG